MHRHRYSLEVSRWFLSLRLGSVNLSGDVHDLKGYRGDIVRRCIAEIVGWGYVDGSDSEESSGEEGIA